MAITVKSISDKSILRRFCKQLRIIQEDSGTDCIPVPADLSSGYTANFIVPFNCHLYRQTWVGDVDMTRSTGFTVNIQCVELSATMVNVNNIWSACGQDPNNSNATLEGGFSGVDWTANKAIRRDYGRGQTFLSAGSLIKVNVSAVSGTVTRYYGCLEFVNDDSEDQRKG